VCETGPRERPRAGEIPDMSNGSGDQLVLTWIRQEFHKVLQTHGAKCESRRRGRDMTDNLVQGECTKRGAL